MNEKRLLAARISLRGGGGLAVSPHEIAVLRQVLRNTPGAEEYQFLEDPHVCDVDATYVLHEHTAPSGIHALAPSLEAAFGHSPWLGLSSVRFQLWEVPE
jgi:hypothetical protein